MNLTDLDLDILRDLPPFKCDKYLDLRYATTVNLPNLESCGNIIDANSATTVDLPKLESCGGSIEASSATTVNLPKLKYCNWDIYVGRNTKKIIIPEELKHKLKDVPNDCEIIHPQTEPKLENFKQYFFRI